MYIFYASLQDKTVWQCNMNHLMKNYLTQPLIKQLFSPESQSMLIKCSKKLYFSKERRGAFLYFDAKATRGDTLSIKCDRILCFSKERQGAYFVRLILRAAFCRGYTV